MGTWCSCAVLADVFLFCAPLGLTTSLNCTFTLKDPNGIGGYLGGLRVGANAAPCETRLLQPAPRYRNR
jgi:hypothetical protein